MDNKIIGNLVGTTGFKTLIGEHKIITDEPLYKKGTNLGPMPEELIYAALIGSNGRNIIKELEEMKIDDFNIQIDRNNAFLKGNIKMYFIFKGRRLNRNKIKSVVTNSIENQCDIVKILKPYISIEYTVLFED